MTKRLPSLLALSLTSCVGGCPTPFNPPKPDSCPAAGAGAVEAIEHGAPEEAAFTAWADGSVARIVVGGQGSDMIPLRMRLTGAAVPECLPQTTSVVDDKGAVVVSLTTPLKTYAEADGSRTTKALYLILPGASPVAGSPLTVTTKAGGVTVDTVVYADCKDCPSPELSQIYPSDVRLQVGGAYTVSLTLVDEAPVGTWVVSLDSSDPAIAGPENPTVTIEPGAYDVPVTIVGRAAGGPVAIHASLNGVVATMTATVTE